MLGLYDRYACTVLTKEMNKTSATTPRNSENAMVRYTLYTFIWLKKCSSETM